MAAISDVVDTASSVSTHKNGHSNESVDANANLHRNRRGPLRPDVWLNSRQRNSLRLRVFYYRGIDLFVVAMLTMAWLVYPQTIQSIGDIKLAQLVPYAVGAYLALRIMLASNVYSFSQRKGVIAHIAKTASLGAVGLSFGLLVQLALDASLIGTYLKWFGLVILTLSVLHLVWACAMERGRRKGVLAPNVVLVGANKHAERLILQAVERQDINIIGIFDDRQERVPDSICGVPVLGAASDLPTHRLAPYLDCIALTVPSDAANRVDFLTSRLSILPNRIAVLLQRPDPDDEDIRRMLDKLAFSPVALLKPSVSDDQRAFLKRLQDIVLGTVALIGLLPFLMLIAVLIRLDSPGPALFRQRRHGFNQEEIIVWKFRTMFHHRADKEGIRQVSDDDDRITRIGRFLRSTSLDELPQILNVLQGEMSLVGPRPHAIGMKTGQVPSSEIVAEYAHRHRIRPGMTGWAAIKGSRGPMHSASDVHRRVQLDIDYIERQSFWFDLMIMARTLPVLLGDRIAIR